MKKINEDVAITDPALMQQYANGQKQLLDKDTQINALQKQIADIQASKLPIQKAMAEIESKAGVDQKQKEVEIMKQNAEMAKTQPVQQAAPVTTESILISDNKSLLEELQDTYVYLKNNNGSAVDLADIVQKIQEEEELRFSSNNPYGHSRTDRRNWYEKPENLVRPPIPPKPPKERVKRMSKREYERELKDIVSSLKGDNIDIDHSIMYDMAENLFSYSQVQDYLTRRWKKEQLYDMSFLSKENIGEPSPRDLIEIITNDLEMFESSNPMSKNNFYNLSESYVEMVGQDTDEEEYLQEDYVFYVKIKEENNSFIGKIYKVNPDGEWYGQVKSGKSNTFNKISYESEYDEMDIIEFLGENYDNVEIIDRYEYNQFIEETDLDEDIIGGSAWPSNSIASS